MTRERPSVGPRSPEAAAPAAEAIAARASASGETAQIQLSDGPSNSAVAPQPGLVAVFAAGRPMCRPVALGGAPLVIGRQSLPAGVPVDTSMSRRHTSVAREGAGWRIADLESRNGTSVDGMALIGERLFATPRVIRIGHTIFTVADDVRPYFALASTGLMEGTNGMVIGARLAEVWRFLDVIAGSARNLHIQGESGTGKELFARGFHDLGPHRTGAFIAVNCAAIPPNLAERLLFGAKKGAYSGADSDSDGWVQAAHGGTLFLDEIGELELGLQAKLLRVLESREVLALGATRPRKVDVQVCSATHRDLRALVDEGRFRQDLFFRLSRPDVRLPPLRERLEEVPYHVCAAVRGVGAELEVDASLVEGCLLRRWPGNVRELLMEVTQATQMARARGTTLVTADHLHEHAGRSGMPEPADPSLDRAVAPASSPPEPSSEMPARDVIIEALRVHSGKVATAARALGVSRIRLRRWIQREGLGD